MQRRLFSHSSVSHSTTESHCTHQSLEKSQRGVTLVEFLVAIGLSSLIAAMIVSITLVNRNLYQKDIGRTRVNQNLRSALDLIGNEIRQAGERFPVSFPAVLITNGASGATDELILRRNLLSEVQVICDAKTVSTAYSTGTLSKANASTAACTYPNQRTNLTAWTTYVASLGYSPPVYLYNQTTRNGQFLTLRSPVGLDTGAALTVNWVSKAMSYAYTAESTSLYMMNQWRFRVLNGVLQIIQNEDMTTIQNVIDGVKDFQVQALMQDGTTKTSFAITDSWTTIKTIEISITGSETLPGNKEFVRTLSGNFFPRNILSN